jgi:GT2 family glycosyltransferase
VIVVDSAPGDDLTQQMIERRNADPAVDPLWQIEYVRAERPGLAVAHNAALPVLQTDVVAFTDDDVIVDEFWLQELIAGFDADDDVACVTGGIMPAEIATWPQDWVETTSGYNKGFERRIFDLGPNRPDDPLFPFTAGSMGSGANMAFEVDWLRTTNGFKPELGTGTIAMGGDDLRAFYDVVDSGKQLVYCPSAIIFHHHHRSPEAVERQCYGYGAGLTAFLTSVVVDDPRTLWAMLTRAPRAIRHASDTTAPSGGDTFPGQANRTRRQRAGMLAGSLLYLRSRKHA